MVEGNDGVDRFSLSFLSGGEVGQTIIVGRQTEF